LNKIKSLIILLVEQIVFGKRNYMRAAKALHADDQMALFFLSKEFALLLLSDRQLNRPADILVE